MFPQDALTVYTTYTKNIFTKIRWKQHIHIHIRIYELYINIYREYASFYTPFTLNMLYLSRKLYRHQHYQQTLFYSCELRVNYCKMCMRKCEIVRIKMSYQNNWMACWAICALLSDTELLTYYSKEVKKTEGQCGSSLWIYDDI